jgi:hypothetical protein
MTWRALIVIAALLAAPGSIAHAGQSISAVFEGDPVDDSGTPLEILPGRPLVRPGADGKLGTADDVVDPATIGDIDLVVRSGNVAAAEVIPPPALSAGLSAVPVGIAGPTNAGGTPVPFTVFLSDGATSAAAPSGHLLAAADMDGLPVIVAAFADFDGDGWIGPTTHDRDGDSDLHLEVRELEPVGRAAALFSNGVAHGTISVRAGLPVSQGRLDIVLVAMALTGPLDPSFFEGAIPSGPGITTALPFLPQRDLNRLIRDRASPAGPDTTLQNLIQFAAIPAPDAYALPLDGSSVTIDGASVLSQTAVRVSFHASGAAENNSPAVHSAVLGTHKPSNLVRWRLVPVDRFENPADPPRGFSVTVRSDPSLEFLGLRGSRRERPLPIGSVYGRRLLGRLMRGTAAGTHGTVRLEQHGLVVAALSYEVDERADRPHPDVLVRSRPGTTLQAAIDAATDRNNDGVIAVGVRAGLYRENLNIGRSLQLIGEGSDLTLIQGDGLSNAVSANAPGIIVRGVTAVGGSAGFRMTGQDAQVFDSVAWRNVGPGIELFANGGDVSQSTADGNGGPGIAMCRRARRAANVLTDNQGAGMK